jgi:hypothetical protein
MQEFQSMDLVRLLLVIVLCGVLIVQGQRSRGRPYRQRSMFLGAAAFAALGIVNLLQLVGIDLSGYALFAVGLPVVLLLASVIMLAVSWRAGERAAEIAQGRRSFADEIKRRSKPRN